MKTNKSINNKILKINKKYLGGNRAPKDLYKPPPRVYNVVDETNPDNTAPDDGIAVGPKEIDYTGMFDEDFPLPHNLPTTTEPSKAWYRQLYTQQQEEAQEADKADDAEREAEAEAEWHREHPTEWQKFKNSFGVAMGIIGDVAEVALPLVGLGHGKKVKGKGKSGGSKPPNKWVMHVKQFSIKNKMSYKDALKDPRCKSSYK